MLHPHDYRESYYIIMSNGLDFMVTGPFAHEELAIEKAHSIKAHLCPKISLIKGIIQRVDGFSPWSVFCKSEWIIE